MAEIQKIRYTHDAIIDHILAHPEVSQGALARVYDFTEGWLSQIMSSDAFKARLAERKEALVDPIVAASLNERLEAASRMSLKVLMDKLEFNPTGDLAVKVLDISTRALGYGSKAGTTVNIQNNVMAYVPEKAVSADAWEKDFTPTAVRVG